jgi:hypothetical protein
MYIVTRSLLLYYGFQEHVTIADLVACPSNRAIRALHVRAQMAVDGVAPATVRLTCHC